MSDPDREKETKVFPSSPAGLGGSAPRDAGLEGALIKDRYRVGNVLGRGGFAVTYLATDTQLDSRPVVVKVLLDHHEQNAWILKKFHQEMRVLARLDHPGVVSALDSGQLPDGRPFLVMQFVKGVQLRQVMNPARGMDLERAGNIVRQVGHALSAAHQEGICHRDVKPENIMLHSLEDGEEHVKLIDFGISSVRDAHAASSGESSKISGTLPYMAPEQFEGKSSPSSDIYALGVVAYEMVTGRPPLVADTPAQLIQLHLAGVRVKPRDLRPGLPEEAQACILKALARKSEDRFARARDFGDAFVKGLTWSSVASTATLNPQTPAQSSRAGAHPRRWVWAGALALAAVAGGWAMWRQLPHARQGSTDEKTFKTGKSVGIETAVPLPRVEIAKTIPSPPPPKLAEQKAVSKGVTAKVAGESINVASVASIPAPKAQVNPRDGLTYAWIPAGTFSMGCSVGDTGCSSNEEPRRQVAITKGFWMGQTEVTTEAFQRVAGKRASDAPGSRMPIVGATWDQARAYCIAVGMRLPTEAEWEYAARGGTNELRYGELNAVAWWSGNSDNKMHEVAGKRPNAYGLYDMLGNAREWAADWYDPSYYANGPGSDPAGQSSGQFRILRGGAWRGSADRMRASTRLWGNAGVVDSTNGFRCAGAEIAATAVLGSDLAKLTHTRVNSADGLTYALIPAGTYTMGCSPADDECGKDETPHRVAITKEFWIGQTEVTQDAYRRVIGRNPSVFRNDQYPVDSVTWSDAQAYCRAAGMRLPTEAEWEYAARGGNPSGRYGDLNAVAWYNANSGDRTHFAGQKQPNEYGLYDMLGNMYEWVSDWFSASYYATSPASDPPGPAEGRYRVLRGGSWQHIARDSRATHRGYYVPGVSLGAAILGMRCVGN